MSHKSKKRIVLLGATGSIGTSCLDVVRSHAETLEFAVLTAHSRWRELARACWEFHPGFAILTGADPSDVPADAFPRDVSVLWGEEHLVRRVAAADVDIVVSAIVGAAGLRGTWSAVSAGKTVALANKETLVMAGPLVMRLAAQTGARLIPVDSEHSAIFQALQCGRRNEVSRLILTASGGPFRDVPIERLFQVTAEDALEHPTWDMGPKITIDSATMMNKALEVIEARWLFDLPAEQIEVVVHPQSIVHSLVEFVDGSVIAQLSPPDMRLPIQYALTWPERERGTTPRLDFALPLSLEFKLPDRERFPALELGFEVARQGGTAGTVLNAANEAAVSRFLQNELSFLDIPRLCRSILEAHDFDSEPTLEQVQRLDLLGASGGFALDIFTLMFSVPSAATLLNVLIVAVGLGLVIFFHELGHFLVAKWCGVYVERFSIGFGQPILAKKWGETEYVLGWLPLGGYVKMLGQDDMDPSQMTDEQVAQNPRSYTAKSVPQRMAIISAGVIMNVVTGMLFFVIVFSHGIMMPDRVIGGVQVGMPAWEAGMRAGDTVTKFNDRPVNEYEDLLRGTVLSRGTITLEGYHDDGESFEFTIRPRMEKSEIRKIIGVFPEESLTLIDDRITSEGYTLSSPGTPAANANFQFGDTILAVDGQRVKDKQELLRILNEKRNETVQVVVRRQDQGGQTTEVAVPLAPEPFVGLGLKMGMGKIVALRKDSPAVRAGLKVGDRIFKVNDLDVEGQLDPFRLTDTFSENVGQELTVTVTREVSGGSPETLTFSLVPEDRDPWSEPPLLPESPLSIPSIGVAYHLVPTVFSVKDGSPAATQLIDRSDTITKVELIRTPGAAKDRLTETFSVEIGDKNWAYLLWTIQEYGRTRQVKLTVEPATKADVRVVTLKPQSIPDWNLPTTRGLDLARLQTLRQAGDFSQALAMGARHTVDTAADIYLMLRGLFTRDISYKGLSGPIGIAKLAYGVASEGLLQFIRFLGLISINLAVINFLPIPVLDGGHMVFLLWEWVTRKKPSEKVVATATYCGLAFVLGLIVFVCYLDLFGHALRQ